MFLNQLQQLGAPTHDLLPARWQQIVGDANAERALRHLPLIELRWTGELLHAYVNRGAWVADCPHCNGGVAVSAEWSPCACLDCGRIYLALVPDDVVIAAATALLERRPINNQNWVPQTEPIVVLQAENEAHGLSAHPGADHQDPFGYLLPAAVDTHGPALRPGDLNLALGPG